MRVIEWFHHLEKIVVNEVCCSPSSVLSLAFWNGQFSGEHLRETQSNHEQVNMRLAVDRFHRKEYKHPMCSTLANTACKYNENGGAVSSVNSSVVEQSFSFLNKLELSFRGLGYPNSTLLLILLLHLWNTKRPDTSLDDIDLARDTFLRPSCPCFWSNACTRQSRSVLQRMPCRFNKV